MLEIFDLLARISSTSSRTAKEALLGPALKTNPTFRTVCQLAYDPFTTFGLTWDEADLPLPVDDEMVTWEEVLDALMALARRELTGHAARDAVADLMARGTHYDAVIICRILNKDLRAGFTATTLNKLHKGLIPEFSCMLAHKFDAKRVKQWPVAVEPKLDGVRLLARVEGGEVKFFSRNGKQEFASMPKIEAALIAFGEAGWFDGEVTVPGGFNETVSQVRTKDAVLEHAVYTVFEYLTFEQFEFNSGPMTYKERRAQLESLFGVDVFMFENTSPVKPSRMWKADDDEDVHAIYEDMLTRGLEGVIVKPYSGFYIKKRSHDWMKIKAEESLDLKVVGAFEGEGKYVGMLGGLIVDHNGVEVRVGSGFTDKDRETLWKSYQFDIDNPGFEPKIIDKVIEVLYHEVTPDGSLRHPRFKCFRFDKETV